MPIGPLQSEVALGGVLVRAPRPESRGRWTAPDPVWRLQVVIPLGDSETQLLPSSRVALARCRLTVLTEPPFTAFSDKSVAFRVVGVRLAGGDDWLLVRLPSSRSLWRTTARLSSYVED